MEPARLKAEPTDGGARLHLALDVDDARTFLDDGYLRLDEANASFSGLAVWVDGEERPVEVLELDVRPHVP